jgi:glycerol kinase
LVIVPAYGGLLSPRWRPDAGGVIHGLGLHTRPRHLVRATMEEMGHMLREVWDCMNTELNMNTLSCLTWIFLNNYMCQVAYVL